MEDISPPPDKPDRSMLIISIASAAVVIGVVLFFVFAPKSEVPSMEATEVREMFADIPQQGTVLGNPNAPVTLIEYGDLRCPACKLYAEHFTEQLLKPVRAGTVKLDFRNWAVLGPDSEQAARAALAAAKQDKYWEFITLFYAYQKAEASAYVTPEFLKMIAARASVEDLEQWEQDIDLPEFNKQLTEVKEHATAQGFPGTPTFVVKSNGYKKVIENRGEATPLLKEIETAALKSNQTQQ